MLALSRLRRCLLDLLMLSLSIAAITLAAWASLR